MAPPSIVNEGTANTGVSMFSGRNSDISTNLFVRIWETILAGIGGRPGPRINASNRPPWVVEVPLVGTLVAIEPICRALTSLAFDARTVLVAVLDMGPETPRNEGAINVPGVAVGISPVAKLDWAPGMVAPRVSKATT